jgi:hypothetical protein
VCADGGDGNGDDEMLNGGTLLLDMLEARTDKMDRSTEIKVMRSGMGGHSPAPSDQTRVEFLPTTAPSDQELDECHMAHNRSESGIPRN